MSGKEFWQFKSTHGLSLDIVIEELFSNHIYPKWDEVLLAAKADGANIEKLVDELKMHFEYIILDDVMRKHFVLMIQALYEKMVKDGKI